MWKTAIIKSSYQQWIKWLYVKTLQVPSVQCVLASFSSPFGPVSLLSSASFLATVVSCFHQQKHLTVAYTTCSAPNRRQTKLATSCYILEHFAAKEPDISLRIWQRAKQSCKETEYWTYIHQVEKNTTSNICQCCSISAGCVNRQLFSYKFIITNNHQHQFLFSFLFSATGGQQKLLRELCGSLAAKCSTIFTS